MMIENVEIVSDVLNLDITLNSLLLDPVSSFIGRVSGDSMTEVGIFDGDLLVIDQKFEPQQGDIIIANYNGQFVCKIADLKNNLLLSANPNYPPVRVTEQDQYQYRGVVTSTIHLFRPLSKAAM